MSILTTTAARRSRTRSLLARTKPSDQPRRSDRVRWMKETLAKAVGFRLALLGALPWSGFPTGAHPQPNLQILAAK